MSGSHSRRKGARFEREVAAELREALPGVDVIRHGETQRDGTGSVPDVQARGILAAEVKHHGARPNIVRELETAQERREPGEWAVGVVKADRRKPIAAMYLEDLLELLSLWHRESRT